MRDSRRMERWFDSAADRILLAVPALAPDTFLPFGCIEAVRCRTVPRAGYAAAQDDKRESRLLTAMEEEEYEANGE
jgi:hypothetical protein